MTKKIVSKPVSLNRSVQLSPTAAQSIAEYLSFMKREHDVDVSINASISILAVRGWQAIQAEAAQKAAQQ